MAASVTLVEAAGMSLTLSPHPGRSGVLVVRLTGTDFVAGVSVDAAAAFGELGQLSAFLTTAAGVSAGREIQWTALGEDLDLRVQAWGDGRVALRVCLGSTSDDACCWQVNATLVIEREELRRAGREAARVFGGRAEPAAPPNRPRD